VRTVPQQREGPKRAGVGDAPGNNGDLAPKVGGKQRAEKRRGPLPGLNDHNDIGERSEQALRGKQAPPPRRKEPGRKLRYHGATRNEAPVQVLELPGVGKLRRAAGNGDGAPAGVQRAVVGDAVESLVQPADERDPGRGEVAGERERDAVRVVGVEAVADNGHGGRTEQREQALQITRGVQNGGRRVKLRKRNGVVTVVAAERAGSARSAGDTPGRRTAAQEPAGIGDPDRAAEPLLIAQRKQPEQPVAGERREAFDRGGEQGEQRGAAQAGGARHRSAPPGTREELHDVGDDLDEVQGRSVGPGTRLVERRPEIATPWPLRRCRWVVRA
jgi:hypothetical protein